jgi:archaellum component FlaC
MGLMTDVLSGLKKVLLLEENVARLERNVESVAHDLRRTRDYAAEIDKRVVRIETMIEMSARAGGGQARITE